MNKIATPVSTSNPPFQNERTQSPQPGLTANLDNGGRRLIYWFHIPKTAGMTIINHLAQQYKEGGLVYPSKNKSLVCDLFLKKKFIVPPELNDRPIVGHFASFSLMRGRESNYYKACFWRHPADWFLSYYNWRNRRDERRKKGNYSFYDFVKSLSHNPMSQDFLLYCGDEPGWKYFFMSDLRKFKRAISLANRFDLFADISSVNDYLDSIGFAENEGIEIRNSIPKEEKALKSLDLEARRRLELLNPVDYYIYRVALGENREQVISEADRVLTDRFQFRDVVRLMARPYYRSKVVLIPFFNLHLRLGL